MFEGLYFIVCGSEILYRSFDRNLCAFYLEDMPEHSRIVGPTNVKALEEKGFTVNYQ